MSDSTASNLRRLDVAGRAASPSKSARTKSAILDAGRRFVEVRPFRDLTVGALMAATEYSRPSFYQHFNDLHGLMEALLDEVKSGIVDGAQPWLGGEGDPVASLTLTLTALVDVACEHGPILKAVADAAPSDARLEQDWEAFLGAFDEMVAARIAEDQAGGLTPKFDPLPVARALNRMDASYLITSFGGPNKADRNDVLMATLQVWLSTLYPHGATQAPPGRPA